MARSTALTKAKGAVASARKAAARARKEKKEASGVPGSLKRLPFTIGGGALVGGVRKAGFRDVMGAPSDILLAASLGTAGAALGQPALVDMAGGAAAVAAARYTEQALGSFMAEKDDNKGDGE